VIILTFVILVDFTIFLINRYIEGLSPYVSTILTIILVVVSCSDILIKYFSNYLYLIEGNELLFFRVIGRRKFLILRIDGADLTSIKSYNKREEYEYNLTFDKKGEGDYIGSCLSNDKEISFLCSPNQDMLRKLRKMAKKRGEKNG